MTFKAWMAKVDSLVSQEYGFSAFDLPDQDYYSMYDSEMSPEDVMDEYFSDLETIQEMVYG